MSPGRSLADGAQPVEQPRSQPDWPRLKGAIIPNCCSQGDYEEVFTSREARGTAARFRRRGSVTSAQVMVTQLTGLGVTGMSVLEVGGGVGDIQMSLLENGVARSAVNVELSPNWESAARELLAERGLTDQVTRRLGDFVEQAASLARADVVIMHRVVCCYSDWRALLTAAVSRADHFVALTLPRPVLWFRAVAAVENRFHRYRGRQFRAYLHPPDAMLGLLNSAGFSLVTDHSGPLWRTVIAARQE